MSTEDSQTQRQTGWNRNQPGTNLFSSGLKEINKRKERKLKEDKEHLIQRIKSDKINASHVGIDITYNDDIDNAKNKARTMIFYKTTYLM